MRKKRVSAQPFVRLSSSLLRRWFFRRPPESPLSPRGAGGFGGFLVFRMGPVPEIFWGITHIYLLEYTHPRNMNHIPVSTVLGYLGPPYPDTGAWNYRTGLPLGFPSSAPQGLKDRSEAWRRRGGSSGWGTGSN